MCGICGFVSETQISIEQLKTMNDTMLHRGPDDSGEVVLPFGSNHSPHYMPYIDPYAGLVMAEPLDLHRVRNGEPKYLVRDLFHARYPGMPIPDKNPMPRPVDAYFADWSGPVRQEFRDDIDLEMLTGNQKWQLWCLERFLNMLDNK